MCDISSLDCKFEQFVSESEDLKRILQHQRERQKLTKSKNLCFLSLIRVKVFLPIPTHQLTPMNKDYKFWVSKNISENFASVHFIIKHLSGDTDDVQYSVLKFLVIFFYSAYFASDVNVIRFSGDFAFMSDTILSTLASKQTLVGSEDPNDQKITQKTVKQEDDCSIEDTYEDDEETDDSSIEANPNSRHEYGLSPPTSSPSYEKSGAAGDDGEHPLSRIWFFGQSEKIFLIRLALITLLYCTKRTKNKY